MKLEKLLFHIFIFTIPFQTRIILAQWYGSFQEWTSGFLWGTDIIIFALLALWAYRSRKSDRSFDKRDFLPLAFLLIAGVSIYNSLIFQVAIYRFLKLVEYVALFFYFKYNRDNIFSITSISLTLLFSGFFQSVIAISQYIIQGDLGLRILGESVLDSYGRGVAVVVVENIKYLRAYGTLPHPNLLATWLIICLFACAWLYTQIRTKKEKILILASFSIILFAFYLTFSRVAIFSAGMLAVGITILHFKKMKDLIIATTAVSLIFSYLFWPQIETRLQISVQDEAVEQRIFYAKNSIESAKENPLFGIGIGQFVPELEKKISGYPADIYQPNHNIYLLVANELGFVGIIVFLSIIIPVLRSSWKPNHIFSSFFCVFIFLGLFDHYFWTLQQGGIMWWGLLGFMANGSIKDRLTLLK